MCGIAGIFHPTGSAPVDAALLRRMTTALAHRGPDGDGFHVEPRVGLGHRRLAIIDLGGGHQPMFNEDFSVAIIFNGEIYNFAELRPKLEALGHVFRSDHSRHRDDHPRLGELGAGLPAASVRACSPSRSGTATGDCLFLARDRMGKKPLYYATDPAGRFLFASELAALAQAPGLPRRIDPAAVEDFFAFGYVPEPDSIFAGMFPACRRRISCCCERGKPVARTAALLGRADRDRRNRRSRSRDDGCSNCCGEATAKRLVADVPLGAFLSGGVDSSAVVAHGGAAAARSARHVHHRLRGRRGRNPVSPRWSPRRYGTRQHNERAAAVDMIDAARLQGAHLRRAVRRFLVGAHLQRLCAGAPARDGRDFRRRRRRGVCRLSPLPLARAGRRRRGTCCRRGCGGMPSGRWRSIYPKLDRAPRWLRAKHTLTELSLDSALGYARTVTKVQRERRRALFSPSLLAALDGHDPTARIAGADGGGRHRRRAGAGAVRRPAHLAARRHPDQGRSRQHGQLAGSALAVPRRGASVLGLVAAGGAEAAGRQRKIRAEAGAGAGCCRKSCCIARSRGSRPRRPRPFAPRRDGCGRGCSARRWPAACCSPPPPWRG